MSLKHLKNVLSTRTMVTFGAVLFTGSAFAAGGGGGGNPLSEYADSGDFATVSESEGLSCTVYRPADVPDDAPVILWGNGTGASPDDYGDGLEHWASWGFVVAAANTSNPGSGEEMIDCLDRLSSTDYADQLDLDNVGTSGHSQGGGGSIMSGRDDRVTATAPLQPYTLGLGHETSSQRNQNGPMLLLAGGSDSIASPGLNQDPVFRRANVPVFYATLEGADHFEPAGDFGDYRGITTAWWLYQLEGDEDAADLFTDGCTICDQDEWDVDTQDL